MNFPCTSYAFGDTTVLFPTDPQSGRVGLMLVPSSLVDSMAPHRPGLAGLPYIDAIPGVGNPPALVVDPLAQIKIVGDPYPPGFAQGHTMRNSPSVDRFKLVKQEHRAEGAILTILESAEGLRIEHRLIPHGAAFVVETTLANHSPDPVKLEMFGSFSIGGITPFVGDDAPERLRAHRFRSVWSAEGRLETQSIEELHLERSWIGAAMFTERFGQVGTMPVRKWFPFVAVEDTVAGVLWGAQLAWAGSWQMEIFRHYDDVCLSGGLADREFGGWMKTLAPGETLAAPPATIACVRGTLDDLCDRLTAVQTAAADRHPEIEHDLPIVFNEWCTTWGDPRHERVTAIADRLQGTQVRYLVIDAGWYKNSHTDWGRGHGDWIPSDDLFPRGLAATAAAIRERGLVPGLWFEMETVGSLSEAFSQTDHLLKRDGFPLTVRDRRFWDLNDPVAVDYLTERVIDLLERCGFGYLKVDYNETAGLGCDHPDSVGEGLRRQVLASHRFFEKIRARLPHLVIENCASGGHRLEPSMMARTAMSSFSDAHELVEIPIVAANLHRLMLPRQSQIWAVLHPSDSDRRLIYSLAATFLGRMCLSGEVAELSPAQWQTVLQAQDFYRLAAPVIKDGASRHFGQKGPSWRHPKGWQAVLRTGENLALAVFHAFDEPPAQAAIPLPAGDWTVESRFADGDLALGHQEITWSPPAAFSAAALLLRKI